jgi:hypothetical protein
MQEAALRHMIGGTEVMSAQLDRLRQYADRQNVAIRYIPLRTGPHLAMKGPFTIITNKYGDAVYTEQLDGGCLVSDPRTVARFRHAANMVEELSRDLKEFE